MVIDNEKCFLDVKNKHIAVFFRNRCYNFNQIILSYFYSLIYEYELYSHDDLASKMNEINKELQEVTNWFKANKLSVNAGKTNYMLLGTRPWEC